MTIPVNAGNSSPLDPPPGAVADQFAGDADERRERSSTPILTALAKADDEFREWNATCQLIDDIYSRHGGSYETLMATYGDGAWRDAEMDLFWSSFEILKPAVYARAPIPAVKPLFSDAGPAKNLTAEILERATLSAFRRTGIDDVMTGLRDDLLFAGRGVPWMRYETDDGKAICIEHLDRTDFRHEPARKWSAVGWVAARFWLSRDEMAKRFKLTQDELDAAKFTARKNRDEDQETLTPKAGVWEVWHRADNRVYWVTEGVDKLLDDDVPHLKLSGFFPCPRPAYATLRRRSLVPVPDWERYAGHFSKINTLTGRIYLLLEQVKMKGLIPAGGDVGDAVEQLMSADDDHLLIPVPGAAMMSDGAGGFVQWLPLVDLATAIQGLISARTQLVADLYELSGISDIMRGATEAEETLGAQQIKTQYGSVRVRGKIDELQRVAADMVKIAAEIISDKFDKATILEMAQMEVPTKRDLDKRIKEIEDAAAKELEGLSSRAQEQGGDPEQAKAALQQAQQQVLAKYAPMLEEVQNTVPIDDVMSLLKDDRARSFAFEVESDSTIMQDEAVEKSTRNEFMQAFTNSSQALMGMAAMGEPGAKLAGAMLKFVLSPYRAGRQLDSAIDAFIDAAPQLAAAAAQGSGEDGMAELAKAEQTKADAALERVKAQREADQGKAALAQAELQRKLGELIQKSQNAERKHELEIEKLRQSADETDAKIDNIRAQTLKILHDAGLATDKQNLDEFVSLSDLDLRKGEQALKASDHQMRAQGQVIDQQRTAERDMVEDGFRERGETRADQQQQSDQGEG